MKAGNSTDMMRNNITGVVPLINHLFTRTALFILSLLAVTLFIAVNQAYAGTETGEWCPTCPDWSNYDSWTDWADDQRGAEIQDASSVYQSNHVQQIGLVAQDSSQQSANNQKTEDMETATKEEDPTKFPIPITDISESDIILDISPDAEEYIEGAISINYEEFLDNSSGLKPAKEIAWILGQAGISNNDSILITGKCLPCGGGPAPAAYSYWVLKYLGHDKIRILDGGIEDARAAGLGIANQPEIRSPTVYEIQIEPDLLATYDFVKNGDIQIVDARSPGDFKVGSIPGSMNIPLEKILDSERLLNRSELEKVFQSLDKDKPVVVYTNTGVQASVTWFALKLIGYDARLYSWKDWLENQPRLDLKLEEIKAEPNPVQSGEAITISATFKEGTAKNSEAERGKEMLLTVKGCSTCAFGSPQSFSKIDQTNGIVQLGSNPKASEAADASLKCTASITSPDGSEVGKVSLLRTSGEKYVGLWNARVPAGDYKISIHASASGISKTFSDFLELEVVE
jgi:thiosulfate/3-mercaptopyruvate sulfurtransferase